MYTLSEDCKPTKCTCTLYVPTRMYMYMYNTVFWLSIHAYTCTCIHVQCMLYVLMYMYMYMYMYVKCVRVSVQVFSNQAVFWAKMQRHKNVPRGMRVLPQQYHPHCQHNMRQLLAPLLVRLHLIFRRLNQLHTSMASRLLSWQPQVHIYMYIYTDWVYLSRFVWLI